jgi:hypothetical protein
VATRKAISLKTTPILPLHDNADTKSQRDMLDRLGDTIEVKSIAFDDRLNTGGDPYNSTGHYVILEAEKAK